MITAGTKALLNVPCPTRRMGAVDPEGAVGAGRANVSNALTTGPRSPNAYRQHPARNCPPAQAGFRQSISLAQAHFARANATSNCCLATAWKYTPLSWSLA